MIKKYIGWHRKRMPLRVMQSGPQGKALPVHFLCSSRVSFIPGCYTHCNKDPSKEKYAPLFNFLLKIQSIFPRSSKFSQFSESRLSTCSFLCDLWAWRMALPSLPHWFSVINWMAWSHQSQAHHRHMTSATCEVLFDFSKGRWRSYTHTCTQHTHTPPRRNICLLIDQDFFIH